MPSKTVSRPESGIKRIQQKSPHNVGKDITNQTQFKNLLYYKAKDQKPVSKKQESLSKSKDNITHKKAISSIQP